MSLADDEIAEIRTLAAKYSVAAAAPAAFNTVTTASPACGDRK